MHSIYGTQAVHCFNRLCKPHQACPHFEDSIQKFNAFIINLIMYEDINFSWQDLVKLTSMCW